jgi:hypothetical protein
MIGAVAETPPEHQVQCRNHRSNFTAMNRAMANTVIVKSSIIIHRDNSDVQLEYIFYPSTFAIDSPLLR